MKFSIIKALVLVLFIFAVGAFAGFKIGYINSEEILFKCKGMKDVQKEFEKEKAKVEQKATDMQKEIRDLKEKLDRQSLLLSKERKKMPMDQIH